jgi:hypothetical protein
MRGWRVILLLLLVLAIIGPWMYERINVPARYPCTAPNFRLEGDFCGVPLSGMFIMAWMVGGTISLVVRLLTGGASLPQVDFELLMSSFIILLIILLLLPLINTLGSLLREQSRRKSVFNVVVWCLAFVIALLICFSNYPQFYWVLWGPWLYSALAAIGLILEIRKFATRIE